MATFLFCHGLWSGGWIWKKVRPLLQARGHTVYTPTYTGLGERARSASPDINLDTHINDVLAVLEYEDLRDVVLVGHSYGGMIATGVADRAKERIRQLIYLDAWVPEDGQSLLDLLPERKIDAGIGDGWLVPPGPLAAGTSAEDVAWASARRRWQPAATFSQPITLRSAISHVPRTYIYCTRASAEDRFGPYAQRAKADPTWRYFELDANHIPNVTAPEALVKLMVDKCLT